MPLVQTKSNADNQIPECSIIIPVFNGLDYTRNCIEALFTDESNSTFELIVVDNGSSDGTEKYLASLQDRIILLSPGENLGFSKANNLAAHHARGKYLVLLNNDTIPQSGWLDCMVETIEKNPEVGVVGAKLLYPLNRLVQHAGVVFNNEGKPYHLYEGFPEEHPAVNKVREFRAVTGACMLIGAGLFREFGGFNEVFINGFEDLDLCFRIRESGYKVVYEPRSVVLHYAEQTNGRHDHERENDRLLFQLWGEKLVQDDFRYFTKDGYKAIQKGIVTELSPDGINLIDLMNRGREKLKQGNTAEAMNIYETCYHWAPHSSTVMRYLIRIYRMRGDLDRVETMLLRLSSMQPDSKVLIKLAENALKLKKYELSRRFAQGVIEAVIESNIKRADAWAILGDVSFKLDDRHRAVEEYSRALEIEPHNQRALTGYGTFLLQENDPITAKSNFDSVLAVNPHHARALLGKGLSCLSLGQKDAAADLISEAVSLDPENGGAISVLVSLLTELGRLDQADRILETYLDRYPDDIPMIFARAGVAFATGQFTICREYLNCVLDVDLNFNGASELDEELRRFEGQEIKEAKLAIA